MGHAPMAAVLRHIRRLAGPGDDRPTDRQLLERFGGQRDEAAFAALLGRHGPMVLGVCCGVLRDAHAAEDAFQATFLILARKAGSIRRGESVGGWLYQVARHAALRARAAAARRQDHERRAPVMASAEPWLDLSLRELQEAVGEELARLPGPYRAPLVLCYLEGKTKDEAARQLGESPGVVRGRLERGRQRLRAQLTKRGLALPAGVFATLLSESVATARVAGPLAAATVRAALGVVGGEGLIGVSAEVAALVQGVSQAMATKFKIVTVLALAAFGVAGAGAFYSSGAAWQAPPPVPPAAAQGAKGVPQVAAPKAADQGETLRYAGKVTEKDTGRLVAGATVSVHRSFYRDLTQKEESRVVEETKHVTDAQGKYAFTIPPEQTAPSFLYIELVVEHPDYVKFRTGGVLSEIRKNEKLGGRPSFEHVELMPGTAISGTVQTPEGQPAAGVTVLAFSGTTTIRPTGIGVFPPLAETRTDAQGRFRLPLPTRGFAVLWLLTEQHAPTTHVLKNDRRGELGALILRAGLRLRGQVLDAKGQPVAGVNVNAQATERNEDLTDPAANSFNRLATSRSAVTSAKGEFEMQPLPPGKYDIQPAERASDYSIDPKDRKPRPLPAVFVATKVTLKEGAEPEPVEVRATPHVVIEAQVYDSKGQPTRGSGYSVSGQLDKVRWVGQMRADADGKMVAYVPHGLENAGLIFAGGSEHVVLRWRKVRDEPLKNIVLPSVGNISSISLSTLTDDVKGIEIVQYAAPVLLVKVSAKDGQQLKEAAVTAMYGPGKEQFRGAVGTDGRPSEVRFVHQEDGRFRSMLLFPDEETTVTAHAEGYTDRSVQVKLAEGATKEIEIVLEKAPQKNDEKK